MIATEDLIVLIGLILTAISFFAVGYILGNKDKK